MKEVSATSSLAVLDNETACGRQPQPQWQGRPRNRPPGTGPAGHRRWTPWAPAGTEHHWTPMVLAFCDGVFSDRCRGAGVIRTRRWEWRCPRPRPRQSLTRRRSRPWHRRCAPWTETDGRRMEAGGCPVAAAAASSVRPHAHAHAHAVNAHAVNAQCVRTQMFGPIAAAVLMRWPRRLAAHHPPEQHGGEDRCGVFY